jgi:hypothetical protein
MMGWDLAMLDRVERGLLPYLYTAIQTVLQYSTERDGARRLPSVLRDGIGSGGGWVKMWM